jgi:RNA polymerase sigma-70 factor (ECF subfamily)
MALSLSSSNLSSSSSNINILDYQENYEDLLVSIEANQQKFNLLIAICDDPKFRDRLIEKYKLDLEKDIYCVSFELKNEQLNLKSAIETFIQNNLKLKSSTKGVISVIIPEKLFLEAKYQESSNLDIFLGYLQWTRENFRNFPYSIVLWTTSYIAYDLEKKAPDFWAWRKGVFRFAVIDQKSSISKLSNYDLILRCQEGLTPDSEAFQELTHRYQANIEKTLYHLAPNWQDRDDLVNEVWIRVYGNIKRLNDPMKFRVWLIRIATNLFYNELRKRKRLSNAISLDAPRHVDDGQIDWDIVSNHPSPDDTLATTKFYERLGLAIVDLPEALRTTIILREIDDMSHEEIAELTGVSISTVRKRIARAKAKLYEVLNNYVD